ncbi:MAG: alpha-amylase family glycosyl hydrolase [Meiothermus sp.]|uniref:alpha-amylase family glycosyl hydrolase n=1 Tax=Meiothermus sp. TaxID=1955249 RepID=UPI0025E6E5EE|nr:alpha-amylase family glycosyl hydrolase [Meiothermus sp.]MCS7194423.1 alpha-amylase family glycosyl hydrolase [Meiothermus sp.]MDW8091097.1 alpha-amylase family glycosyl hydrolase [Meiothermus sp.]
MRQPGVFEFHVSRRARDRYRFDLSLFSLSGNVILADFQAARRFAAAMNARRPPEQAVSPAQINAMGLIDEVLHLLMRQYLEEHPGLMRAALGYLAERVGGEVLERTLRAFAEEFPPLRVYRGELSLEAYMEGQTEGIPHREVLLEELLMLHLANANPAFGPFLELFDDASLEASTAYPTVVLHLERFFESQPAFGEGGASLLQTLRLPARLYPDSLEAQLRFLLERFGGRLGAIYYRLLVALDVVREAARSFAVPVGFGPPQRPAESPMLDRERFWASAQLEPEAFSPDLDWMPQVVLLAKNTFVWLDQLSKRYARPIQTLDAIPEEELKRLQDWGVNALWLIGLWERSRASRQIKRRMGNPEALASAYAVYDYTIAEALGGEAALEVLRRKAARYGIRLAADMVPNHTAMDGRWVVEHPDWFISLPYPPFPSYSFSGPDLSEDPRVGLYLEDHYYDRSDAAVVFKRVDRQSGEVRYIYHGNDGTAMPWNDTAQLNYLLPEVREAVIQTILKVARRFPILRFDAAMTLTRRHYQRLWWPPPGGSPWGPSVPSRAEHAMPQEDFDRAMPQEFWREVVDRVAQEAPDTLLLAEAFWMMEGYFVRSLGMHRVYNSAFMNMLRDEENARYREVLKNTLEFEPEILKRFVNFLSNPDEKTALEQFGKGDKYFGVMTLCATLPGLPMLAHGQVEGLAERYGMEYARAYYEEAPDEGFVAYHQEQIAPLLKNRALFAEVENFVLYDAEGEDGVNQDVFAYSNRRGEVRALVVYHNKNAVARVCLRRSVPQLFKTPGGREVRRVGLAEGLGLRPAEGYYSLFRDRVTGLEYLRPNRALLEGGLCLELGPYQRRVFMDWREVHDADGSYAQLWEVLGEQGVPSLEEARLSLWLAPVHAPLRRLITPERLRRLSRGGSPDEALREDLRALYQSLGRFAPALRLPPPARVLRRLEGALWVVRTEPRPEVRMALLGWALVPGLGAHLEEWRLRGLLQEAFQQAGLEAEAARRAAGLVGVLATPGLSREPRFYPRLLRDPRWQEFLGVNRFAGETYFNREAHALLWAALRGRALALAYAEGVSAARRGALRRAWSSLEARLNRTAEEVGYRLLAYLAALKPPRARRAGDDLTRIWGIGPSTAQALRAAGFTTYAQLAKASLEDLRRALVAAGRRGASSLPTWPQQAAYLAAGDRLGLAEYLRTLFPKPEVR